MTNGKRRIVNTVLQMEASRHPDIRKDPILKGVSIKIAISDYLERYKITAMSLKIGIPVEVLLFFYSLLGLGKKFGYFTSLNPFPSRIS